MKYTFAYGLAFLLPVFQLLAQSEARYTVEFPNAVHHEVKITAVFSGIESPVLEARMVRSSPGRYALHEFAKNVYAVKAENSKGEKLEITRPNPHQWNVSGHDGTVKITYTLFGDRADGTYAGIDESHAHLNAPATFLYAHGFENKPSKVTFEIPAGKNWRIATQLHPETQNTFSAPNLQYLMDSPIELSEVMWQEWQVQENGKTKTIRVALHHQGTKAEFDQFTEKTKKIVREAQAVFGELPDFDFGTYTFIGCYGPQAASDGMEHRNSTSVTAPRPLKTGEQVNLGTVSHEFFHAWNVERIRPKDLEPFNFEDANMSNALWFAEGFTDYYGDLLMCRSGVLSEDVYLKTLSNGLNSFLQQPGKDFYSAVEMSQQAPFVDAARSVDPVNRLNTYVSYYTHGGAIALALDLTLRTKFPGISLDDYMRTVWQKYGKPEKPYQLSDLEITLAEVTKNEPFASEFFQKYVYGHAAIDFKSLFREAGLDLRLVKPGKASLGFAPFSFIDGRLILQAGTMVNSPLYLAGLEFEDVVLTIGGKKIGSEKALQNLLNKHKPGDKLQLEFEHRGQHKTSSIILIENPTLELVKPEKPTATTPENAKTFRQNWLGAKAKG